MDELNEKMRDRWQDRRKKGSNWPKLIVMVLILVAILVAMNMLNKASQKNANAVQTTTVPAQDSIPAQSADSTAVKSGADIPIPPAGTKP